jgi:sec-independent protein translocase protein TatA
MLGTGEVILILLAALILFGPSKLPELARTLGKGVREFKRAQDEVESEITQLENVAKKEISDIQLKQET